MTGPYTKKNLWFWWILDQGPVTRITDFLMMKGYSDVDIGEESFIKSKSLIMVTDSWSKETLWVLWLVLNLGNISNFGNWPLINKERMPICRHKIIHFLVPNDLTLFVNCVFEGAWGDEVWIWWIWPSAAISGQEGAAQGSSASARQSTRALWCSSTTKWSSPPGLWPCSRILDSGIRI